MSSTSDLVARTRVDQLHAFIETTDFPCVGAKSALARHQLVTVHARSIDSAWDDLAIHQAVMRFAHEYEREPRLFQSLVVMFDGPVTLSEAAFEAAMWRRLQSMSDKDKWLGQPVDSRVDNDPDSPHFSLSFGGQAFFVVGLHPDASRKARRFAVPVMVFNLHDQFVRLRAEGRYEKLRSTILARDERFSGTSNPMLARHGSISEARQYSGRAVEDGWRCPFSRAA